MHTDPDTLALLAIGERDAATPDLLAHIEGCPSCRQEYAALREAAAMARVAAQAAPLEQPAPAVWERITAELALTSEPDAEGDPSAPSSTVGEGTARPSFEVVRTAPGDGAPETPVASIPVIHPRAGRFLQLALVAALALIVGVGGTLLVQRWTTPQETVLSTTQLAALPDWAGSTGRAELEVDSEGHRWLVIWVDPARPVDGLRQVWLINTDVSAMLQVGLLSYSGQRFLLPDDVDVGRYPVVDVSDEPATDDGAHSGNSIVRGILPL